MSPFADNLLLTSSFESHCFFVYVWGFWGFFFTSTEVMLNTAIKKPVTHFTCQNFCSRTLLFILILASCSAFIAPSIVFRSINSPSNWYLIKLTEGSTIPACPHLSGGLFLVCEDLGRTLDNSFPASTFFF